jgi:ribosome recycling factor
MDQILDKFQSKCDKILQLFQNDIATIKTGRAKPSLVEGVKVNVYESWMEVRELASISAPDAQTIEISPWDKMAIKDIAKGIADSDLKVNPIVSGDIIRISIPALTEESRQEFVKLVNQKAESHKAMIRAERAKTKRDIEDQKDSGGISEDDIKSDLENLQKITDDTVEKIDQAREAKEREITSL